MLEHATTRRLPLPGDLERELWPKTLSGSRCRFRELTPWKDVSTSVAVQQSDRPTSSRPAVRTVGCRYGDGEPRYIGSLGTASIVPYGATSP